ncbi:hypothetical protein psal_cds_884 [Pandoravirus salinus]|uniref:Uncharacterized protein n=1 Tax=Pandoravirus salinus TaxID=1349410 RepID=S4VX87_9VIRU|nr:hypothetical protein psal_cds_884 [Pandoravirus salinus]AGO84963.1 hypothetical protein psal_cds_884 [Pandoravirus salinus]
MNTATDDTGEMSNCTGRVFDRDPEARRLGSAGASHAFFGDRGRPCDPTPEEVAAQIAFYEQYNGGLKASQTAHSEKEKSLADWEAFDRSMADTRECDGLLVNYLAEKDARRSTLDNDPGPASE